MKDRYTAEIQTVVQKAEVAVAQERLDTEQAKQEAALLAQQLLEAQIVEQQKEAAKREAKETGQEISEVTGGRL